MLNLEDCHLFRAGTITMQTGQITVLGLCSLSCIIQVKKRLISISYTLEKELGVLV